MANDVFVNQTINFLQNTVITGVGIFAIVTCLIGIIYGILRRKRKIVGASILCILIISLAMPKTSFLNLFHVNIPSFTLKTLGSTPVWVQVVVIIGLILWLFVAFAKVIAAPWKKKQE